MTGWQTPEPESTAREVVQMTDYEIIMIFLEVIGTLIASCSLLIALLTYLRKRK